jgi:uncharacterized protein YneF (UPF0154 family)
MDTWIIWLVGCSVAFWIGKVVGTQVTSYRMIKAIAENPDAFINISKKLKQLDDASTLEEIDAIEISIEPVDAIIMEIEELNGQVYAYDKATGQFLAQAQSIYQAAVVAAQRFPGKKFWHPSLEKDHQTA